MKPLARYNGNRFAIHLLRLILVAFVLGASGCSKSPKLPRLGAADVIVAFGDSLTYGTGAAEQESYPAVLAQLTGRQVVRAGVPGEVTAEALRRLPGVIAEYQPRLMVVCLGGNDMLRKVNEAETRANLRAIIAAIRERGIVKDVLYSAGMKSDAIHPNAKGYQRMAEAIAGLLRKSGAI